MDVTEKYVDSIKWIRDMLTGMDELAEPIIGILDWDDAVCIEFGGKKLVVSADGPYNKRLVLKSALIHAATDVVVKGGKPMFCLDTVIGLEDDAREMIDNLKNQAEAMKIPILGGNTLIEEAEPRANIVVAGELVIDEPIRDSGACKGDVVALIGEPIWGEQDERIEKARTLFDCWFNALEEGVKINSSKDVTKGGIVSVIYEMQGKSRLKFALIDDIPYPLARNLDNFLVTLSEKEYLKLEEICRKNKCPLIKAGTVSD